MSASDLGAQQRPSEFDPGFFLLPEDHPDRAFLEAWSTAYDKELTDPFEPILGVVHEAGLKVPPLKVTAYQETAYPSPLGGVVIIPGDMDPDAARELLSKYGIVDSRLGSNQEVDDTPSDADFRVVIHAAERFLKARASESRIVDAASKIGVLVGSIAAVAFNTFTNNYNNTDK